MQLFLLSRSTLEPLISLDRVGTKFCFRARLYCYYCLYNIFSANTVRRSEDLRGGQLFGFTYNTVCYPRRNGRLQLNRGWCALNIFSLSDYKFIVNMEPIQGNQERREPILREITSASFFPSPLSRRLPLQWPMAGNSSGALHLLVTGPAG